MGIFAGKKIFPLSLAPKMTAFSRIVPGQGLMINDQTWVNYLIAGWIQAQLTYLLIISILVGYYFYASDEPLKAWKYCQGLVLLFPRSLINPIQIGGFVLVFAGIWNLVHFFHVQRGWFIQFKRLANRHLKFDSIDRILGSIMTSISVLTYTVACGMVAAILVSNKATRLHMDALDIIRGLNFAMACELVHAIWFLTLTCYALTCICFLRKCHLLRTKITAFSRIVNGQMVASETVIREELDNLMIRYGRIVKTLKKHNEIWSPYVMINTITMIVIGSSTFVSLRDSLDSPFILKIAILILLGTSLFAFIFMAWLSGIIKETCGTISYELYSLPPISLSSLTNGHHKIIMLDTVFRLAFSLHKRPLCFTCGSFGPSDYKLMNRILTWVVTLIVILPTLR
jgi:hypothetical protein